MGHYDDCYEAEEKIMRNSLRKELKSRIDAIESKEELIFIKKMIYQREEIKTFFKILKNGI